MYTGFNVSIILETCFDGYYEEGEKLYKNAKDYTSFNLNEIIDNGIIDGDKLQNMWFPDKIFHSQKFIFISHSHKDEKLAIKLAGFLHEKFGIYSFIDSCVWGYMDELNKKLNNCNVNEDNICHKCNCSEFTYNLSYVHIMLASALMTMIDKCECLFFLNTPSSINIRNKTESPWIYYELNIANVIRKRSDIQKSMNEEYRAFAHSIEFTPKLDKMTKINEVILNQWKHEYNNSNNSHDPFDILYRICGGATHQ